MQICMNFSVNPSRVFFFVIKNLNNRLRKDRLFLCFSRNLVIKILNNKKENPRGDSINENKLLRFLITKKKRNGLKIYI